MPNRFSRRTLLRRAAYSTFLLSGSAALAACGMMPAGTPIPALEPRQPTPNFVPDLEIRLRAAPAEAAILPGRPTQVWRYQAELIKGEAASIQMMPAGFLGPTLRVRRGWKVRVHFSHELPGRDTRSIIHWHGLTLPSEQDAHPRHAISRGQSYAYEFTVNDRAGTYWYHPHPDMTTGRQVYQGLAGLLIVSDDEEQALGLPAGAQDLALVIQDRTFDHDNQLVYAAGDPMHGSMAYLMGFLGERVLVNGQLDAQLEVATSAYRIRLLNGSNARTYKLGWSDGTALTVIASDGGLLERPLERPYVMLAPGERIELWADFRDRTLGSELRLVSLAFSGAEGTAAEHDMGAMGAEHDMGAMGVDHDMGAAPPQGAALDILRVRVSEAGTSAEVLPTQLSVISRYSLADAVNRERPRTFTMTQPEHRWELNGRVYEPGRAAAEQVRLGDLEVWEVVNALNDGPTMHPQGMLHPFHIHGLQFQVIERTVHPELRAGWESVSAGYVDEGWKDTVLLMPGERVKLLLRFADYSGTYMVHCHMLEHEDMGLMADIEVVA